MTESEWLDDFSYRLTGAMQYAGFNQKILARESGLSEASISNYINGTKIPNAKAIVNLAYALECEVEELIDFGEKIE